MSETTVVFPNTRYWVYDGPNGEPREISLQEWNEMMSKPPLLSMTPNLQDYADIRQIAREEALKVWEEKRQEEEQMWTDAMWPNHKEAL